MTIVIAIDDLSDHGVSELLAEHQTSMNQYSPAESNHALDASELHNSAITFWSARDNNRVAACGALKIFGSDSGEIKSMKTRPEYLKRGLASGILDQILAQAVKSNLKQLYLETGSHESFKPATALYEKYGFIECAPFGDYKPDPYSLFYKLILN